LIILKNIGEVDNASVLHNISSWVKTLKLGTNEVNTIAILEQQNIILPHLLDVNVSLDHILAILKNIKLRAGVILPMLSAIKNVRKENEINMQQIIEITNAAKEREREISFLLHNVATSPKEENAKLKKDIFISYYWQNKQMVRKLYDILKEKGFNCWIDDNIMQGGAQLFGEIDNGISDCKIFIACCSNSYGASVNCQRELLLATDRKKLIIPTVMAVCDPWPPRGQMGPLLAGKLYVDISTEEKFDKTINQLTTAIFQSLN